MEETRDEALNKRSEIMGKCRHILPHLLNNFYSSHNVQLAPAELDHPPDTGQQEEEEDQGAEEQELPPEPPDQGEDQSQATVQAPQPSRIFTRSMARKEKSTKL
eukprot:GFUD01050876.1.p2 GENE.GFUD01050876.1~~GFUD01050876.1.p2  ORF type:complete len:104 (+),score=40.22 GFUD01050876.1:39-350(+)